MFCAFDPSKTPRSAKWGFSDIIDPSAAFRMLHSEAHAQLRQMVASKLEVELYELQGETVSRIEDRDHPAHAACLRAAKGVLSESQILNHFEAKVVPILDNTHAGGFLVSFFQGPPDASGLPRLLCLVDRTSTGPECFTFGDAFMAKMGARLDVERVCFACGKAVDGRLKCARCRTARYCSRECQKAHWPEHKGSCGV
jgi:hypothetical protein